MVSASAYHAGCPGSIHGRGKHVIFDVQTWLTTLRTVRIFRESEKHSRLSLGCKRATEDEKHTGSTSYYLTTPDASIERSDLHYKQCSGYHCITIGMTICLSLYSVIEE